jgi:hypothetical protein
VTGTKPGAAIPESQRHTVQRKLRISPEASAMLDELTAAAGVPASRLVEAMIELEHAAMRKPKRRKVAK